MRTQSITDMLRYEATKRPAVAALLHNVEFMTEEEIMAAKVPLPWYRKALLQIHAEHKTKVIQAEIEALLASGSPIFKQGTNPDFQGLMCQYTGDTEFMPVGVRPDNYYQVVYGSLVFYPKSGGVWVGTMFSPTVPQRLLDRSVRMNECSKLEYNEACRQKRNNEAVGDIPYTVVEGAQTPTATQTALSGVQFY